MPSQTLIRKSDAVTWPDQGEWVPIWIEGKITARVGCPGCGTISAMSDHDIAADGSVTPSVGCPNDCGYHEVGVVFEDWGEDE